MTDQDHTIVAEEEKRPTRRVCGWNFIKHWFFPVVIFFAPIIVISIARFIFNGTIEVGRIDTGFLPGASFAGAGAMRFIPSAVVSSLYNFGFALCAVIVLSIILISYASWIVVQAAGGTRALIIGYFIMLIAVGIVVTFDIPSFAISHTHIPAAIARSLIDQTLDHLPTCDREVYSTLEPCPWPGIGNTGNSLERIVSLALAAIAVAGLAYITTIAVLAGSEGEMEARIASLRSVTLLAAMTFLMTIIAVHLLFQPGADMIIAAYAPMKADDIASLRDYTNLRNAMTLYWATVFSLALGTCYFAASTFAQGRVTGTIDFGEVWDLMKILLTVLSPLLADGALKLAEALVGHLGS